MKTVLITGLGRSGSTVVQKVLNSHPDVFISDESWHFYALGLKYANRNPRHLMGMSDFEFAVSNREFLTSVYSKVSAGATIWGDKCPPAFSCLSEIKTILDTGEIPLSIIWTVRHPYDIALSWIERFGGHSLQELSFYGVQPESHERDVRNILKTIFKIWKQQQETMKAFPGYVITYENMTETPEEIMRGMHDFLNIEFYDKQLEAAFTSKVIGGDPKFGDTTSVHNSSRFRYKEETDEKKSILREVEESVGLSEYMQEYAYDI